MSAIPDKLRKLLALAAQGVGGEAVNARAMLESLMKKHGVSLPELEQEARGMEWFKPARGVFGRRLLVQVIVAVSGDVSIWKKQSKRGWLGAEVTKAEAVEIELRYSAFLPALEKELAICFSAFVQTNRIFNADAPCNDSSEVDMEELKRIALAMMGMSPVEICRTLTNTPD